MSKMSFLQKLGILIEIASSSYWLLIAIAIFIAIGVVLIRNNRKNKKKNKIIYIILSLVLCTFLLITYHNSLNQVFDYLVDNLFVLLLFPNYAFYFLEIVITNIILWISLFHNKTSEAIKRLNIIIYLLMTYILVLVLSVIDIEQLDIFTVSSLYSNEKATALMELSSLIFITWIIFLTLYKIILSYLKKDDKELVRKVIVKKEIKKFPTNYVPIKIPKSIKGSIKSTKDIVNEGIETKKFPANYVPIQTPIFVKGSIKKKKEVAKENVQTKKISTYLPIKLPYFVKGNIKEKKETKKSTTNYTPSILPKTIKGRITEKKDIVKEVVETKEIKKFPTNYIPAIIPKTIKGNLSERKEPVKEVVETKEIKKFPTNYIPSTTPKTIKGRIKTQNEIISELIGKKVFEDNLTLEDYRQIQRILIEIKEKNHNIESQPLDNRKQPIIDLEKEKIEEMKRQEEERDYEKYTELDRLFREIR